MIVSHARRFVLFPDPLGGSPLLVNGLESFGDPEIVGQKPGMAGRPFFTDMSPVEAEWAFDSLDLPFRSYIRIAVIENPFSRMVRLYERIAENDPLWIVRKRAGFRARDFCSWLQTTNTEGFGAAGRHGPRWRRFGSWSAKHWCGDHITHVIRQEAIEDDLHPVLAALGLAPAFDTGFARGPKPIRLNDYYNERSTALIKERYAWDLAQFGYGTSVRRAG